MSKKSAVLRSIETHIHTSIGRFLRPLQVSLIPIGKVKRSPRNIRTRSQKQLCQIVASIEGVGFVSPILVDEHNNVIAGHGRLEAAIRLKFAEIPAIVISGLSDIQKRALAIADNKIAANAGWDRGRLVAELTELNAALPELGLDISITGFEPAEIDALAVDLSDPETDPADVVPLLDNAVAISKPGDSWILGPHRLVCGDAREEACLRQLMQHERASMVSADVPYNLCIGDTLGRGKIKHREFQAASGEMSSTQFIEFLKQWMRLAARYSEDGSIHFVFIDWRHLSEILAAGNEVYTELKNVIVWVKTNAGQGSFYRSQHELIFAFKSGRGPHQNNIELGKHGRNRSNVWTYAGVNTFRAGRLDELSLHPTVKPIALIADAIRDCTSRGQIVLDPFMGSGTTILAAERVGRRAYGLEIDPLYVDVALRRWQSFTKRDAILKATGQPFDEIAAGAARKVVRRR
ncbi:site-specific DNA-methyltransferase [Bradyrhizobium sp. 2TAF36]|uniref:site-specific DNA-methyltransferase n=1 Tax=Bradyrhizobium sp. 2TAF36 TaxID=3233016 RepID=UPI003F8DB5E6